MPPLPRRIVVGICLALALAGGAAAVMAFPNPSNAWLSRPGLGDGTEAGQYYAAIGAPNTLSAWKTAYGFPGAGEVSAIYYNAGDLGFGREMHCRKNGGGVTYTVACYVINHGLGAATPVDFALDAAIAGQHSLPAVAMTYSRALDGQADDVRFYIYDAVTGARLNSVPLDSQGEKYAPQMCLACHGGFYDSVGNTVYGANFLPFDTGSFKYSQQAGYTLAAQEEKFRQLNALVKDTNPPPAMLDLIDGWYAAGGGVGTPGASLDEAFTPAGYAGDAPFYHTVVAPYCRSCHVALTSYPLAAPADLINWNINNNLNAGYDVFHVFEMPHAELTNHNFWSSDAPAALANRAGWASVYRVTRTDDHAPDGCQPSDCTLREAILAANAGSSGPLYKAVITFGVNGTFTLTRAGNDDTASTGDLDITGGSLLLLGNGADQTVIDAGGLDRVFHILNGAIVVLQGVTLQNGNAAGDPGFTVGGAVLNDGSQLTLNASLVQNNQATSGGGLSNFNNALTTVNGSAIVNNAAADGSGGGLGVFTGSSVTVNNTTIGGNTADRGGGAYVSDLGSTLSLNFSTLARNTAATGTGGGVRWISDGAWSARNSLVAGNTGTDCAATASAGAFTSQGFNLFGQNGGANGCLVGGTDKALAGAIGTALSASLAAARAGVPAYALVPGGPAVDAVALGANCALPSFDVADQPRPADGDHNGTLACDLGALELRTGVPGTGGLSLFLPLIVR